MEYDIAGLGNALVDALVRIDDDALLDTLGLQRGTMHPVDHEQWERIYQQVDHSQAEIQPGGSCANTIATAALLGASAIFCGQVGRDDFGQLYADRLAEACGGHALQTAEGNTGKCLSLISTADAERTLVTHLGVATELPGVGQFADILKNSRVLHVTGYLLLGGPMRETAWEAMEFARKIGLPISLDVADPFVVQAARADIEKVLESYASLAFLNEEEAAALVGGSAESALNEVPVSTTVVKLGSRGSLVKSNGETFEVGIRPTEAIDTTGAGDAYAGGFLYGWCRGWTPDSSGRLGAHVASLTVGQIGAVFREREALDLARKEEE